MVAIESRRGEIYREGVKMGERGEEERGRKRE